MYKVHLLLSSVFRLIYSAINKNVSQFASLTNESATKLCAFFMHHQNKNILVNWAPQRVNKSGSAVYPHWRLDYFLLHNFLFPY